MIISDVFRQCPEACDNTACCGAPVARNTSTLLEVSPPDLLKDAVPL